MKIGFCHDNACVFRLSVACGRVKHSNWNVLQICKLKVMKFSQVLTSYLVEVTSIMHCHQVTCLLFHVSGNLTASLSCMVDNCSIDNTVCEAKHMNDLSNNGFELIAVAFGKYLIVYNPARAPQSHREDNVM